MVSSLLSLSPLSELAGASVVSPNRHLRVPDDVTTHALNKFNFHYLSIYILTAIRFEILWEKFIDALLNVYYFGP